MSILQGATVLITGASSGIGRELARLCASAAERLILVARRQERLEELSAELCERNSKLDVVILPCDLTDRQALEQLLATIERDDLAPDVLINNAGLGDVGLFELSDSDKNDRMLELNIRALTTLTRALLPYMVTRQRGGVLMISSGFGLAFMPGFAAYVGTKHYVTGFTECLRIEVKQQGVHITQVCPGPVATEFEQQAGNGTGMEVPPWMQLDATQCAREALTGFEDNRATVIPGAVAKIMMAINSLTPRWLSRWVLGMLAPQLRQQPAVEPK